MAGKRGEFFCCECGRKYLLFLDISRSQCFQCEKVEAAGNDQIAIEVVEKTPMCKGCGLLMRRLKGDTCDACAEILSESGSTHFENRHQGPVIKSGVKEPRGPAKMRALKLREPAATMSDPIEIDDSDHSDVHIATKVESEDVDLHLVRSHIEEKKKNASHIRLTKKEPSPNYLPTATKQYLAKKASQRAISTNGKVSNITFRIHVALQHKDGRNIGTRVPFQTKTFQTDDEMTEVFDGILKGFNDEKGKWLLNYPGKVLTIELVQFTFLNGSDIRPEFMLGSLRVFWHAHTVKKGVYIKQTDISDEMVSLKMLVPYAYVAGSDEQDSDPELPLSEPKINTKGKAKATTSRGIKREADEDVPRFKKSIFHSKKVKVEPNEEIDKLDKAGQVKIENSDDVRNLSQPTTLRFRLSRSISFTREILKNGEEFEQLPKILTGSITCMTEHTEEWRRTFKLKVADEIYYAHLLNGGSARFDVKSELDLARTELLRQHFLRTVVDSYMNSQSQSGTVCTVPENFLAIVKTKSGEITNIYVCQAIFPLRDSTVSSSILADSITHHSFVESNGEKVISDIRIYVDPSNNDHLFAWALTHRDSSSGVGDCGVPGIQFCIDDHECGNNCNHLPPFSLNAAKLD
ncbi:hypothetical protein EV368DRAFT_78841 [Lentinula lateritia]|nr:hypothetical protein EV368DRAFT_78841 [Lentinula lateritia]